MNIQDYYRELNAISQDIFNAALENPQLLSKVHSAACDINQLAEALSNNDERLMLNTACSQLEFSCLAISLGLYRPAIGALRLALELGMGSIYFSAHKLDHHEWLGNADLKWGTINGCTDGVLSNRFVKAFFPELAGDNQPFLTKAGNVYRGLSEYVHGNSETWMASGIALRANPKLRTFYEKSFDDVISVLKFSYAARHLKQLTQEQKDSIQSTMTDLLHIEAIREIFGGPKDIK